MSKEFSMDETEAIIANFQNGGSPLANYLNELSDVSKIKLPPIPPSIDGFESNVRGLRSAKKGMTIFAIEAAIIAAAATSAAALSGIGPEPVVNFVQSTAGVVTSTVEKVASFVTGGSNSQEPAPETTAPAVEPSPSTSATPAPSVDPTPSATQTPTLTPTPTPTPTKSAVTTPSAKADPKPTGIGVPSPSKGANNDDDEEDGEENEHSVTTPSPTIKATIMASPKATVTKSSESAEKTTEKPSTTISSPKPTSTKRSESTEKKKVESVKSPTASSEEDD